MRILHTGDLHLSSKNPKNANIKFNIQVSQLKMLENIINTAKKYQSEAVLICGDIFDEIDCARVVSDMFYNFLVKLSALGIKTYIVFGNHDYYCAENPLLKYDMPDNVTLITSDELTKYSISDTTDLYAASFTSQYNNDGVEGLSSLNIDADKINIIMLHADLNSAGSVYNRVSLKQLEESGADYIALSHIHKSGGVQKTGNVHYAYSSNPQPRHFGESGDNFVIILDIEKNDIKYSYVKVSDKDFYSFDIAVNMQSVDEIAELINKSLKQNSFYRITLKGKTDKYFNINTLNILIDNSDVQIINETSVFLGDDVLRGNNLTGKFIIKMNKMIENASDEKERAILNRALAAGLNALLKDGEVEQYED